MYVITVVPLKRGIGLDTLSYFGSTDYPKGTMLTIPIRNNMVLGLVTDSKEVSAAKTALRAATFSLRKLPPQTHSAILGKAYIDTARELANYYASPLGGILYNLLAPDIRNGDIPLPHTHHVNSPQAHAPQVLAAKKRDRFLTYRSLVRETFAHSGSVLCVVPTSTEADELKDALLQGIGDRIIMFTSAMTKTQLKKSYELLEDFSKTKLIISTPSHSLLERHDITVVIIEHSRSPYYKELNRPYIDYRDALRIHAKHTGRKLIFADLLIRAEEEAYRRNETYTTLGEECKRIDLPGKLEIIEMTRTEPTSMPFRLFSEQVLTAINDVKKKKGRIFMFAARRGLAPVVACMDCGYIFRSPESGAPYSLIRTTKDGLEERWFICSTSGEKIKAQDTCPSCNSWKLRERGIGIQQVYDELHKVLPDIPTILFDHITARTYKKATFLRDSFYKEKGVILLGTHMSVPYLTNEVDLSIIVNMDALLATPTWRLEEENLSLLLRLREVTVGNVFVQTRSPLTNVLQYAKHGTVEQFYSEELELRKSFNYPPYATFVHFTWQGSQDAVKKIEDDLIELFKEFPLSPYQNPTSTGQSTIMYGLIRVPNNEWPNKKIAALLSRVPPTVRVVINPDKIV
ncbi:MAG: hypothetical protein K9M10_01640 [Candidatus Pacebacteria bacterium]|nr:hypothetical protein [Candidatus Paceibacterota bacterium]MCF7857166.1 hypothetical protein [Candidatus Paceibacterota bacterium]